MTKAELLTEVTAFITDNIDEEDGEVDLDIAATAVEEFIDSLDTEDDEEEAKA